MVGLPISYTVSLTTMEPASSIMLTDTIHFAGALTVKVEPTLKCNPMSSSAVTPTLHTIICKSPDTAVISGTLHLTLTALPLLAGWVTNTVVVSA